MVKDETVKDFSNKFSEKHGYSSKSLAYRSDKSLEIKFDIVTAVGMEDGCSILDVGCGFGDHFNYLKQKGIKNFPILWD